MDERWGIESKAAIAQVMYKESKQRVLKIEGRKDVAAEKEAKKALEWRYQYLYNNEADHVST